jgi:hypothetical protein
MKHCLCILAVLFLSVSTQAAENYSYFIDAQSINGPTGNIQTPSTRTLSPKSWSFGLHRYIVGLNYGLLPDLEAGISFNLKEMTPLFPMDRENFERKKKEISLHSKYRLLREEENPLDVTIGQRGESLYLMAGKYLPSLWDITLQSGMLWQNRELVPFFAVNGTSDNAQVMFDYEAAQNTYNIGCRFLISPEMKLDFMIIDCTRLRSIVFDNFYFGITVAG